MTRKDYIAIAQLIWENHAELDTDQRRVIVDRFCVLLSDDNPRFSASRFRAACESGDLTRRPAPRLDPSPSTLEGARFYTGSDIR